MGDLIGQKFGAYELTELLGRGGMASVYRARQVTMNRDVAVKVIESNLARDPEFVKRFEREAQLVASLSHPHILKVFDFGQQGELLYLVMELLMGGSLRDKIADGGMPLETIERLLDQIASALDFAHGRGIVHRDLKPPNVLLDEQGNAVLTDFGIAKLLQTDQGVLTQSGVMVGTPAYMPPEQWQGLSIDGRADGYALGVMLYEMLSGVRPFVGETPTSLMYAHFEARPEPVRKMRPDLPETVEWVLFRALAKDPDDRFATAGEMARAFRAALVGGPISEALPTLDLSLEPLPEVTPPPVPANLETQYSLKTKPPFTPAAQRPPPALIGGAAVIVALFGLVAFFAVRSSNEMAQQAAQTGTAVVQAITAPVQTLTAAATLATRTPTPTVTPTLTPTLTLTPSLTPLAGPTAAIGITEGELLVLIADFRVIGESALDPDAEWEITLNDAITRLKREQRRKFQPRVLRVPVSIDSADEARRLSSTYRATLVIWGRVRAAAVETFYTLTPRWGTVEDDLIGETRVQAQSTLDELRIFVSAGGDTEYKLNFVMAQLAYFGDDPQEAIPFLTRCIALAPAGREAEVGLAAVFFYRGYLYEAFQNDPKSAIEDYTRAIALDPSLAVVYQNRGNNYDAVGEFEKALADFNQAIALDAEQALYFYNRAKHFDLTGDFPKAIEDFTAAIALDENFAAAYNGRGVAHVMLNDLESAAANFGQAAKIDPDVPDYHLNLGIAYGAQGKMPESLASLSNAIEIDPTFDRAFFVRGSTYRRIGDQDKALADLDRAITLNPKYVDAYNERGLVHQFKNEQDKAIADFSRAIDLNPDYRFAYSNRAFLYTVQAPQQPTAAEKQAFFDRAIADYQKAISLAPNDPALYAALGTTFDLMGSPQEALTAYRTHIELAGAAAQPNVIARVQTLELQLGATTPPLATAVPAGTPALTPTPSLWRRTDLCAIEASPVCGTA